MSGALVTQFNFEYKSIKYIITKTIIVLARWYSLVLELPARKYLFDKDILRYIWKGNNDLNLFPLTPKQGDVNCGPSSHPDFIKNYFL